MFSATRPPPQEGLGLSPQMPQVVGEEEGVRAAAAPRAESSTQEELPAAEAASAESSQIGPQAAAKAAAAAATESSLEGSQVVEVSVASALRMDCGTAVQ